MAMATESATARLNAFCDGVFAFALTLLVLEIKSPLAEQVPTAGDLWLALEHLVPALMAFLLSFAIILISWVNHRVFMNLVDKTSPPFIYANGFLLLTVVMIPFATALPAEFGFTDAAAPAVVIYASVNLLSGIAWALLARAALHPVPLMKSTVAKEHIEMSRRQGLYAIGIYTVCVIAAFWFPRSVTVALLLIYVNWLIFGLRAKET
jgi:uncharacterized membrane protein